MNPSFALKSVLFAGNMLTKALMLMFAIPFCAFYSVLVVIVTPFWLLEVLFSRRVSTRLSSFKNCESYLDWMFALGSSISGSKELNGLRLWGVEFVYR